MGRQSRKEKAIKLRVLEITFKIMKRNHEKINPETVRKRANKIGFLKYFNTEISKDTLGSRARTEEFIDFRNKIINYKEEQNDIKKLATHSLKEKNKALEYKVKDLLFNLAQFHEKICTLEDLVESANRSLEIVRKERDILKNRITKIENNES